MSNGTHSSVGYFGFIPKLATTVQLGLIGLLLILSAVIWLSIPMLGGIVNKAAQVRNENLPELTRWRYNTQRVEQLYGFIETIYWTHERAAARASRLHAQVLIDSFAFENGSDMALRARNLLESINALGIQRDERRTAVVNMQYSARKMLEAAHSSKSAYREQLGELAAAGLKVGVVGVNWRAIDIEAQNILDSLNQQPNEESIHLNKLLQEIHAQLLALETIEQNINIAYQKAVRQQRELATLLNTDAALKTQQIASEVEYEASQIRTYSIWILLIVSSIAFCVPWLFQRFLVRPILQCSRALQQISTGEKVKFPERTLLQELDTICQSVCQYGEMTHKLQQANQELLYLARHDGLTGLANRRTFDEVLENEHARARRGHNDLTLVLLDIDHFKKLNDQYGHPFGDTCLRKLADILREFSRRPGDLAARYGGEEFALVFPDLSLEQGKVLMERFRTAVSKLVITTEENIPVSFTISAGLVHIRDMPHYKPKDLIHLADLALYRAKQSGRNRVEIAITDVFDEA